jgi:cis-3-alkyl-4-acyloxetan-2-one decarboxylase
LAIIATMTLRLEAQVEGIGEGETLVFVQGWPDDATLWDEHVARLADRYRCVRVTMPNFDGQRTARWGYTTDQIVDALATMVREVSPTTPVTLILHDWGCYWGYLLHHRHPELVARVAGLDIAPHVEPGPGAVLGIIAYQWWLIAAFLIDGAVGDWMTRAMARSMQAPRPSAQITSWMNYPYRNVWREILRGSARNETASYWPRVPLLFVYGKKKPFPFHSKKWIEHVESSGGKAVGLDCGHWVQLDPSFMAILEQWLDASKMQTPRATEAVGQ